MNTTPVEEYFEFGNYESDEEDKNLIEIRRLEKEAKLKQDIASYKPIGYRAGWFHLSENESVKTRIQAQQLGITQLKFALEEYYYKKEYNKVIQLGEEILDNLKFSKVNNCKEIIEIIIRAALKLNDIELAYDKIINWKEANDLGHHLLKGIVYGKKGLLQESLFWFKKYNAIRPNDYQLFNYIAQSLLYYQQQNDIDLKFIIFACYKLGLKIMKTSQWNLNIEYIKNRFIKEEEYFKNNTIKYKHINIINWDNLELILDDDNLKWLKSIVEQTNSIDLGILFNKSVLNEIDNNIDDINEDKSVIKL